MVIRCSICTSFDLTSAGARIPEREILIHVIAKHYLPLAVIVLNSPILWVRIASSKNGPSFEMDQYSGCNAVGAWKRRSSRVSIWRTECHLVRVLAVAG